MGPLPCTTCRCFCTFRVVGRFSSCHPYGNESAGLDFEEFEGAGLEGCRLSHECEPELRVIGHAHDVEHDTGEVIEQRLEAVDRQSVRGPFRIGLPFGAG